MIASLIFFLLFLAARIVLPHFVADVPLLAEFIPWLTWLCVGMGVLFVVFVIVRIAREVWR